MYLRGTGERRLLNELRKHLNERQLIWVLPDVREAEFTEAFQGLDKEPALSLALESAMDVIEEIALSGGEDELAFQNAQAAGTILWNRGPDEQALKIWSLLAVAEPRFMKDPRRCVRSQKRSSSGFPAPTKKNFGFAVKMLVGLFSSFF